MFPAMFQWFHIHNHYYKFGYVQTIFVPAAVLASFVPTLPGFPPAGNDDKHHL